MPIRLRIASREASVDGSLNTIDEYRPCVRLLQQVEQAQQRGLARTARADDRGDAAVGHVQVDVAEGGVAVVLLGEFSYGNHRCCLCWSLPTRMLTESASDTRMMPSAIASSKLPMEVSSDMAVVSVRV